MDFIQEHMEGKLAEAGFLKETYEDGDLKRAITDKGRKEIKKILGEKKYQLAFKKLVEEKIKESPERKDEILYMVKEALLNLNAE